MRGRAEHLIAHTGQHYDHNMSGAFFTDLGIPEPDVNLGIGSGGHGEQTGAMLAGLEKIIKDTAPDWVLVYGDTNSTLAAAVAAVKLHVPVAHLEAGLRSFNRRMPEEHNRVLTDHAADLLLAPTRVAMDHLATEGLAARSVLVGDVMTDVLFETREKVANTALSLSVPVEPGGYYVATLHRPDNTDDPQRLRAILDGISKVGKPVVLLAHPRLRHLAETHGITLDTGSIELSAPVGYPELVNAVQHSAGVITDSGGLQKEAYWYGVPCVTMRPSTEWAATVDAGANVLVDDDPGRIAEAARNARMPDVRPRLYGDGHASERIAETLVTLSR